ncbi:MAG: hypothetical protein JO057_05105 [Chloroflexi bacterium]|nr:hypothetical protein [Chloroflexota bacterium]
MNWDPQRYAQPARPHLRHVPFLRSVRQVLDPEKGAVLAKMCDTVNGGVLQWQVFELVKTARSLGWQACDYQVRVRAQPIDPKWIHQHHVRRGVTFWLVLNTGQCCPSRGLDLVRVCATSGSVSARTSSLVSL